MSHDEHRAVKLTFAEAEARRLQVFDAAVADFERDAVSDDDRLFTLHVSTACGSPDSPENKALAELLDLDPPNTPTGEAHET